MLLLNGSPHPRGETMRLLEAFADALSASAAVTQVNAFALLPAPCDDCGYCRTRDGCAKRDLDEVYALLEQADVLVWATPVYNYGFPAPLKALIDRCQRYWSARFVRQQRPPIARPKQAVLLTACGEASPVGGQMLEQQLRPQLTILNARLVACVHRTGCDSGADAQPALEQARAAARALWS